MFRSSRLWGIFAVLACVALTAVVPVRGEIITLEDLNSRAQFEPNSADGQFNWVIDGVDYLVKQWFWFRIGPDGGERPVSTLPLTGVKVLDSNFHPGPDTLFAQYTGEGLLMTLGFVLTGSHDGSRTSDIAETISIKNISAQPLKLHFFQYVDLNLGQPEMAEFLNANTVRQLGGQLMANESVITPASSHREAALAGATLASLNDGLPTTLNDNVLMAGPNVTWAFQWDVVIPANGTFLISKDKQIIPEPATMVLLGIGSLVLGYARQRQTV